MKNFVLPVALILKAVFFPATCFAANSPLIWNTFMGGSDNETGYATALDASGNIYIVGASSATWGTPLNPFGGTQDAFVAKFDGNGILQWHTFLGGSSMDYSFDIVLGNSGYIYLVGTSYSTWGSPLNPFGGGACDAFLAKLDVDGTLLWHTFLGGNDYDWGRSISMDDNGNVYMVGHSYSTWGNPLRPFKYSDDVFLAKFNADGELQWNTFWTVQSGYSYESDITVSGSGNIYVVGGFDYDSRAWPTVNKYDTNGNALWGWSEGPRVDCSTSGGYIALDKSENVYFTGYSDRTWGDPLRPFNGAFDSYAAKLDSNGNLQWSTFLGGSGDDSEGGIALDGGGNIYIAGASSSPWGHPLGIFNGGWDGFVAKLNNNGALQWNTFLGGSGFDSGSGIVLDGSGYIYAGGISDATWGSPVGQHNGGSDAFLAQLAYGVKVTSPDGGESWPFKSLQNITWKAPGLAGKVALSLYRNGVRIGPIATCPAARGYYAWKAGTYGKNLLPVPAGSGYTVKITGSGTADMSDGPFSIYRPIPSLEVTLPKGGENWQFKSPQDITWTAKNITGSVALILYRNGRKIGWIASCPATKGSYSWKVGTYGDNQIPVPAGSGYSIRITGSGPAATSPGTFAIFR